MLNKVDSLYIHIPFCRKICTYCDFCKLIKNDSFEKKYLDVLNRDIFNLKKKYCKFKTIFIGGGTPSCLSIDELKELLNNLKVLLKKNGEFSIETNPEDLTDKFLKTVSNCGINRISIGIQTFDKEILNTINRTNNIDLVEKINNVLKYINNINLDFIYGLPGYNENILKNDLNIITSLNIKHCSFYSLIVDKGSLLFNQKFPELNDAEDRKYYNLIVKSLKKAGFIHYEVSNFAKKGYECKHNITYWRNKEYVALGLGASGYESGERYKITTNYNEYILNSDSKEIEKIDKLLLKEYYLITNLRLLRGFSLKEYSELFNEDFLDENKEKIEQYIKEKLIKIRNNRIFCTEKGIAILDSILINII